ncbi:hypothetical protein QAD02_001643 [Eretmocerus hayati]|uniref:Uncharacterized protein n=1 Tax=Eretmocerus hayati TaxID=131215 RepID=A0ACC2NJ93_9HYME|nr:hypothetical protein QAD02_001643 [Eretmocerus hayati]
MLVPKAPIQCEDVSQESEGSERESMDPNYFYQHIQNIFRNDLQQLRLEIKDVLKVAVIEGRSKSIHNETMRNSSSMLVPKAPIQCEDVSQEPEGSERESMDPNYFYQHIQNIFRNDLQQLRLEIKDVLNVGSHCKCFGCIIAETLQESHLKSGGAMAPKDIRDRITDICKSMRLGRQEDAHEFFLSLLQTMNVYLATEFDVPAKDQPYHITPVDQIFGGCTMTGFKCTSCSHVVKRFDNTLCLSLDIREISSLECSLKRYFQAEIIREYKCDRCQERGRAVKRSCMYSAPRYLCLNLNRFDYFDNRKSKLCHEVEFGSHLNMTPFTIHRPDGVSEWSYELIIVIAHMGNGAGEGHYVTYAQTSNGIFHYFNDDQDVTESDPLKASNIAYILIYKLVSPSILVGPMSNLKELNATNSEDPRHHEPASKATHSEEIVIKLYEDNIAAVIEDRTKSIHIETMRNLSSMLVPKASIRCEDDRQHSELPLSTTTDNDWRADYGRKWLSVSDDDESHNIINVIERP